MILITMYKIAGQDTTATSIAWMVKYLDENPDVLDKLRVCYICTYFFLEKNKLSYCKLRFLVYI